MESISAEFSSTLDELLEEYSGDGDKAYFSEMDKVNKANANAELKKIITDLKTDKTNEELIEKKNTFELYIRLCDNITDSNRLARDAKTMLDKKILTKYAALSETEIKQLIVENKWIATIEHTVNNEMQRISQRLTQRIKELAERYESPMPVLSDEVSQWEEKVNKHLREMGFSIETL